VFANPNTGMTPLFALPFATSMSKLKGPPATILAPIFSAASSRAALLYSPILMVWAVNKTILQFALGFFYEVIQNTIRYVST
jgi:hypothetical protein